MKMTGFQLGSRMAAWCVISLLLSACAADRLHSEGLALLAKGKPEEGVRALEQASAAATDNARYREDFLVHRAREVARLLTQGERDRSSGRLASAEAQFLTVLRIEPSNRQALAGLTALERSRDIERLVDEARQAMTSRDLDRAAKLARDAYRDDPSNKDASDMLRQIDELQASAGLTSPQLRTNLRKPISVQFRDASLRSVLDALARSSGVDFILDKDVRPDLRTTVLLRDTPLEEALGLILQSNSLAMKVLNTNAVLIYANSPDKVKEYQELIVRGFYLENADAGKTQLMLKSMLKVKDTWVDEKLNLLMVRDTPAAIRLAEKLIAMHDLAEPEVMLDVEVLEVKRSRLNELGVQWSTQFSIAPLAGNPAVLSDLKGLDSSRLAVSVPSATLNLRRQLGDADILANPSIRARNRERAKILIGDKLPVTTNTATATGLISENIQYLDVGIKLEAEPTVHLQGDVAIRIALEVSSIVNEIRTPTGSLAYQIGTRSASTVLRLKDGETQILAGLISDEERRDASRVPALGDLPLVGRLFGRQKDEHQKTEIVLSITPHLVRNIERPAASGAEFWSGTEAVLSTSPLRLSEPVPQKTNETNARRNPGKARSTSDAPRAISFSWNGATEQNIGEPFKISLRMAADGGIRGVPLQFIFDPTQIQVVSIAEGDYFDKIQEQIVLSSNVHPTEGKAMVSLVRAGSEGTSNDATLVVLTLKPLRKGTSEISLASAAPMAVGGLAPPAELPKAFSIKVN